MDPSIVIVSGGNGFIGRTVVRRLLRDHTVVVLDQQCPPGLLPGADCVVVDLTSDASVREALQQIRGRHGGRIASVIHLAAYFDLEGRPNPNYERVTLRGTERLLRELQGFQLEQFVFTSTMLVQAPGRHGQRLTEDSPLDSREPPQPYAESKRRTEALLREQHDGVPLVIIRPAGVYDEGGHAVFIAHQIARIYEERFNSRVYPGNLDTGQPYLHIDDLAEAVALIVQRRASLPQELPLLLAETDTPTYRELQDEIGGLLFGHGWTTLRIPQAIAMAGAELEEYVFDEDPFIRPWMVSSASDHYEIDISRARQWLGWEPRHSLRATLPQIIAALKADPTGWYRSNKLNAALVADRAPAVVQGAPPPAPAAVEHHHQQMRAVHFSHLWGHFANLTLGAWLLCSPFAFGLFHPTAISGLVAEVTRERGLADPALRLAWLGASDVVAGLLVMLFSVLSLSPRQSWAPWANTVVGLWLLVAPLLAWSPSAAAYDNDTLVGALVIAFAVLVPVMPGMADAALMDPNDVPPGWTYCPSTHLQRLPIVALALVGFLIARQLAAYQMGHAGHVWDPFFSGQAGRNGTETIITSRVSRAWPVPDAGLGAVAYMLEALMGAMGSSRRWRTMPWMVAAFGIIVVPLGLISIFFIVIQPIVIGTWCTLCLVAAAAMLAMLPYALDELVATGQFLVQCLRRGEAFWRVFFVGSAAPGGSRETQPEFDTPLAQSTRAALCNGVNLPWSLQGALVLGAWLMFTRLVFGSRPPMADSDHLVGALVLTVTALSLAEVARVVRLLNVLFGAWLVIAPWILSGGSRAAALDSVVVGIAIAALSLPRGTRSEAHYDRWDRLVI